MISEMLMKLSDEDICKFQILYRNEFGIELSKEDAYEKGIKLLRLISIVYRPMSQEKYCAIQKHRQETKSLLIKKLQ